MQRGTLIGEAYGAPVSPAFGDDDEAAADVKPFLRQAALYVFSTPILPGFQARGYGKILKAHPAVNRRGRPAL